MKKGIILIIILILIASSAYAEEKEAYYKKGNTKFYFNGKIDSKYLDLYKNEIIASKEVKDGAIVINKADNSSKLDINNFFERLSNKQMFYYDKKNDLKYYIKGSISKSNFNKFKKGFHKNNVTDINVFIDNVDYEYNKLKIEEMDKMFNIIDNIERNKKINKEELTSYEKVFLEKIEKIEKNMQSNIIDDISILGDNNKNIQKILEDFKKTIPNDKNLFKTEVFLENTYKALIENEEMKNEMKKILIENEKMKNEMKKILIGNINSNDIVKDNLSSIKESIVVIENDKKNISMTNEKVDNEKLKTKRGKISWIKVSFILLFILFAYLANEIRLLRSKLQQQKRKLRFKLKLERKRFDEELEAFEKKKESLEKLFEQYKRNYNKKI